MMTDTVVLDGSRGEGGGQVLRTGMALCALMGRPLEIVRIRAGRRNPGLAAQHLTGVRALVEITGGEVEGAAMGSQALRFAPGPIRGGAYTFDVSEAQASAGSVGLLFQAVAPVLAYAPEPSRVTLRGGTHVRWAPPVHYLQGVLLPALARMGLSAGIETETWGWYPEGGGTARAEVRPVEALRGVDLTARPDLGCVDLLSAVSNLPVSIARRQQDRALRRLQDAGLLLRVETFRAPSPGKGTFVFLLAHYDAVRAGFSALGELGKPAERVADEAVDALLAHHAGGQAVDPHLADQLVPYIALAEGPSAFATSRVTPHLMTVAEVAAEITGARIGVEGEIGGPGRVTVEGIGFKKR
ncbi:MAG: RNA 3'-terminal-phosphate cyclase [Candidatus Handelsmanbacteria bacterium RIFCSPLOWO2_12_FULL_64_10]|uniref:RNA 3'-terminal phosphate cyclase n=1 Tax=Handelsmanbacteria sp. (strain RIFCSPLOWO2_12_FULL_64_10) TaxID=1817868 RepID=A0A1F6CJ61_HANXR|nr:MAG: RNA 3'-terminal-phosphate cyclase [Candidatus Handelsmanbacteria bacterium RIFCSPLOWO2_12_FULL_64_10]